MSGKLTDPQFRVLQAAVHGNVVRPRFLNPNNAWYDATRRFKAVTPTVHSLVRRGLLQVVIVSGQDPRAVITVAGREALDGAEGGAS